MRLIHTTRLELKSFFDTQVPKYAILSHTWGDDEVSFQDFIRGGDTDSQGWTKIKNCCLLARERGLQWAWVDTCCIDKTSSAELSEAINSMYRWYKQAKVCFVFLSDFNMTTTSRNDLSACRWFTRGWTLQELLAPYEVLFYDRNLLTVGTRDALAGLVSDITGVGLPYLHHRDSINTACVAERMFWAAKRETTRVEDQAYCLLGLFDVNIPLLYGEGEKAFARLQQEIIARSSDESIFAWTVPSDIVPIWLGLPYTCGMLAPSVAWFVNSGGLVKSENPPHRPPSASINRGIHFAVTSVFAQPVADLLRLSPAVHLEIPIACAFREGPSAGKRLAIHLIRESDSVWLWHREVDSEHYITSRMMLCYEVEAIVRGYRRINIAILDREPHRSFDGRLDLYDERPPYYREQTAQNFLLDLFGLGLIPCGLFLVIAAMEYIQRFGEGMNTSATTLSQLVVLMWYWRLWNQSMQSILLLLLPVAYASPRLALVLIAYLLAATLVYVMREYRRR